MPKKMFCAAVVSVLMPMTAFAEEGDAYRGKAFAQQLCAGCHAIDAGETASPLGAAPAFGTLFARSESWTAESFANWLGTGHPTINGVAIKPAVAADILAYVRSLGPPKQHAALEQ